MPTSKRSSPHSNLPRTLVTFGSAAVLPVGATVCLLASLGGEPLIVAMLTSLAAMAASMNTLVAVATFLASHPRDAKSPDMSPVRKKGKEVAVKRKGVSG